MLTPIIEIITAYWNRVADLSSLSQVHSPGCRDSGDHVALYLSYEPIKKLGGIQNQYKQALASLLRLEEVSGTPMNRFGNPEHPVELCESKRESCVLTTCPSPTKRTRDDRIR